MEFLSNFFVDTFLFKGIPDSKCLDYLSLIKPRVIDYQRGESVYSPNNFYDEIGFIISGTCVVEKMHNNGSFVQLNSLTRADTFGVISALSDLKDYPTHVIAKTKCKIVFIKKADLQKLIAISPDIALNTVRFLADRIVFLNTKVTTFTSGSCDKKLATELLTKAKVLGGCELPFNKKRTAESICCGRASLYRSLESLKSEGLIDYDNKKIFIKDPEGLERISK